MNSQRLLLLDSGVASAPFVDAVNDYINTLGHHGMVMICSAIHAGNASRSGRHSLCQNLNNFSDEEVKTLKGGIENMIRCAFRENADYDVRKTWPYSRFPSQLGREIHKTLHRRNH